MGAGISLVWLFAVLVCNPHRVKIDNQLAALSHLSLSLLLLVCCIIQMYHRAVPPHHPHDFRGHLALHSADLLAFVCERRFPQVTEGLEPTQILRILGLSDLSGLGHVVVLIPTLAYGAMVTAVTVSVLTTGLPYVMHDTRTGQPVVLSLERGRKFHLFLSHIWGTGQDQVAAIKRQLCLLVPGISIFLDVDDLEEISALERYIDETAVIIIFLSKGYVSIPRLREHAAPRHHSQSAHDVTLQPLLALRV